MSNELIPVDKLMQMAEEASLHGTQEKFVHTAMRWAAAAHDRIAEIEARDRADRTRMLDTLKRAEVEHRARAAREIYSLFRDQLLHTADAIHALHSELSQNPAIVPGG